MKYYFVSDVHLGVNTPDNDNDKVEQRFIEWLDFVGLDAEVTIYLLGDIFDFWFEYPKAIPPHYERVLAKFREMTSRGIAIHFFKGNHDMWLRDYLSTNVGLILHGYTEIVDIEGEKIMVGHGHDIGFTCNLSSRLLWAVFSSKTIFNIVSFIVPHSLMMRFGRWWSGHSRKSKDDSSRDFMGEEEYIVKYINRYIDDYKAKGVTKYIFGHFHAPEQYWLGDGESQIMILSEWHSDSIEFGEYSDGKLFLHRW